MKKYEEFIFELENWASDSFHNSHYTHLMGQFLLTYTNHLYTCEECQKAFSKKFSNIKQDFDLMYNILTNGLKDERENDLIESIRGLVCGHINKEKPLCPYCLVDNIKRLLLNSYTFYECLNQNCDEPKDNTFEYPLFEMKKTKRKELGQFIQK